MLTPNVSSVPFCWMMAYALIGCFLTFFDPNMPGLQPQHAAKAFRQICTGISFMHSESCVHRDLKPANVFISSHGIAKLGDFG